MPGKRIVLLEMPTEDAEDFVRSVAAVEKGEKLAVSIRSYEMSVEAVVARPTSPCKCAQVAESKYKRRRRLKVGATKDQAWRRGPKFGWWVCSKCNKPSLPAVQHWISSMLVGANDLLPVILGTGPAIPPSLRWQSDGGVPNEAADADHHSRGIVEAMDGTPSRRSQQRLRKPRRSDIDRQARS